MGVTADISPNREILCKTILREVKGFGTDELGLQIRIAMLHEHQNDLAQIAL